MFGRGAVDTCDRNSRCNGSLNESGQARVEQDCRQSSPFKSIYASF